MTDQDMSIPFAVGARVIWTFPGSGHEYAGNVTEVCPIKKNGDQERYRIKGDNFDCYAFRTDLRETNL